MATAALEPFLLGRGFCDLVGEEEEERRKREEEREKEEERRGRWKGRGCT